MTNPDGAPLTRRQLREQAEAAAAAAAAQQGAAPPVPAYAVPAQAPQMQPTPQPAAPVRVSAPAAAPAARPAVQPFTAAQQPARPAAQPAPASFAQQLPARGPSSGPGASSAAATLQAPARTSSLGGAPVRQPAPQSFQQSVSAPAPSGQQPAPVQPRGDLAGMQRQSRVGQARAEQAPSAQAPQAVQQPVSRRSLREQSVAVPAVVVPPRQTGTIRRIDETGELTAMARGSVAPASPLQKPASAPVRQSVNQIPQPVRSAPAQQAPAPHAPVAPQSWAPPATSWGPQGGVPAAVHAPAVEDSFAAIVAGGTAPSAAPARPAVAPAGLAQAPAPAPAAVAPAALAAPAVTRVSAGSAPSIDTFSARISAPAEVAQPARPAFAEVVDDEPFTELPQWDAITTGAVRTRDRSADLQGEPAGQAFDLDEDDDLDDFDEPDHRYTWLHYVILVAVAFVFGLILWKVGLENRSAADSLVTPGESGVVELSGLPDHDVSL